MKCEKHFVLGWLEQPTQDNYLVPTRRAQWTNKEGPLSYVLLESSSLPQFQQLAWATPLYCILSLWSHSPSILQISLAGERELNPLSGAAKLPTFNSVHCTEAEFLDVMGTRGFLLAIHSRKIGLKLVCNVNITYTSSKAVNREDKRSRRYRDRDFAKFERSRRYRDR